jgi:hypothetical protein
MLGAKKTTIASANRFASFAYKPEPKRERERLLLVCRLTQLAFWEKF